jgi:glycerol-3-phosphate dehydrogenase (NAD(P)+)
MRSWSGSASAMGARAETLMGLSGLGDLVLTCSSELSRNFAYGIAVGSGQDVTGLKLAEGVHTVAIANEIAGKAQICLPGDADGGPCAVRADVGR